MPPTGSELAGGIVANRSLLARVLEAVRRRAPWLRRSVAPGYDVFVSYAHEDVVVARFVARYLETAWVPWRWSRRCVFLDSTGLCADGSLDENIRKALASSRFLVVVCSEHAVA